MDNMKNHFAIAIKEHLDVVASFDTLFGEKYNNSTKTIEQCCNYIASEMKKLADGKQCLGVCDDDVFGLAIHFYDEDISAPDFSSYKVLTSNPQLTDEEKAMAHKNAVEQYQAEELRKLKQPKKKATTETTPSAVQLDLFA